MVSKKSDKNIKLSGVIITVAIIVIALLLLKQAGLTMFATKPAMNIMATDDWAMFMHDASHSGYTTEQGPVTNDTLWVHSLGGYANLNSPVFSDNVVYDTYSDFIGAFDSINGGKIWENDMPASLSPPAFSNGIVYAGDYNGNIYAFNATNGNQVWNTAVSGEFLRAPTILNDVVYFGNTGGYASGWIYAINVTNGNQIWNYSTVGTTSTSLAVANGGIYFATDGTPKKFYALNTDGTLKWELGSLPAYVYSSPAVIDGVVYFGSSGGYFYALNAINGSQIWDFTAIGTIYSSPAVADGMVYFGSTNNNVYALNADDGTLNWSYATGGGIYSSPAVSANGIVYIGSNDNNFYALNADDGTLNWSYAVVSDISTSCAIANRVVYVGAVNGDFYAIGTPILEDTTPPIITIVSPSQNAVLASGTTSVTVTISTDEEAECRYSTSDDTGYPYGYGSGGFNFSNGILMAESTSYGYGYGCAYGCAEYSHSFTYSVSNGQSYTFYYKCSDNYGNVNNESTTHSFSVASPSAGGGGKISVPEIVQPAPPAPIVAAPVTISLEEFLQWAEGQGINVAVEEGTKIDFQIATETGAESHSITVLDINEEAGTITLLISSEPMTVTLHVGETREVDVDGDGTSDILIIFNGFVDGKADIVFKNITPAAKPEEISEEKPLPIQVGAFWNVILLLATIVIFVVLVILIVLLIKSRIKKRKEEPEVVKILEKEMNKIEARMNDINSQLGKLLKIYYKRKIIGFKQLAKQSCDQIAQYKDMIKLLKK